ncbi:MAG: hypothetical protein ACRDPS_02685 [Nocardioides sp.]|uniref:hypothetical protein n=1 Tax=Nocardioides sp. TaxID=35761 RepID=UPI003D6A9FF6
MIRYTIAVGLAAALLTSCGGAGSAKDSDGRVIPSEAFIQALGSEDVIPLVQDGTTPDDEDLPGLPDDPAKRLTFLTTGVAWPSGDDVVGEALRDEARSNPEFLGEIVQALAASNRAASRDVASPLLELFGEEGDEVLKALADDGSAISSPESMVRALNATGADGGSWGLTQVRRGLTEASEDGVAGVADSAGEPARDVISTATRKWIIPRAVADASLFAGDCAPEESECSELSGRIEESLTTNFSFEMYKATPTGDLPATLKNDDGRHLEAFAAPQYELWHAAAAPLGYNPRGIANQAVMTARRALA